MHIVGLALSRTGKPGYVILEQRVRKILVAVAMAREGGRRNRGAVGAPRARDGIAIALNEELDFVAASQGPRRYVLSANTGRRRELCEGRVEFDSAARVGCSALQLVAGIVDIELDEIMDTRIEPGCGEPERQGRAGRVEPHIARGSARNDMVRGVLLDEADVGHTARGCGRRGGR